MFDEEAGGVQCTYAPEGDAVMGGFGGWAVGPLDRVTSYELLYIYELQCDERVKGRTLASRRRPRRVSFPVSHSPEKHKVHMGKQ